MATATKLLALAALLISCAGTALADGDAAKGEKVFAKCKACHTLEAGKNRVGPSLAGLFGRTSGTVEGFKHSEAMVSAAVSWDETSLDASLTKPKEFILGNKMVFPGLKNEQDRLDVIAHLKGASQ